MISHQEIEEFTTEQQADLAAQEKLENSEEDSSEGGYTSCGACNGYGCDRCMPDVYLEEE